MPSKEYVQMINKGLWLERYLNPDIKTWEYRELAQEAAKIYNIHFLNGPITPDFALSDMARYIEEQSIEDQEFYKKGLGVHTCSLIGDGDDPLKLRYQDGVLEIHGPVSESDKNINRHIQKCAEIHLEVYWFQALTRQLFKKVSNLDRWEDALLIEGSGMECSYFEMFPHYSRLFQEIGIDQSIRDVSILNSIELKPVNTKKADGSIIMSTIYFFPWSVLVSRIAFDYLFSGGKNYFAFCQNCGKFSAGKRKGEKKFCSDNCRSLHRHRSNKPL